MTMTTTFQTVFDRWTWKPIRNCPGRFIFAEGASRLSIEEIVGRGFPVFEFAPEIIPDRVLVMKFDDGGGLISYQKAGGAFLHTLNDQEGFTRKAAQLGFAQQKIRPHFRRARQRRQRTASADRHAEKQIEDLKAIVCAIKPDAPVCKDKQ